MSIDSNSSHSQVKTVAGFSFRCGLFLLRQFARGPHSDRGGLGTRFALHFQQGIGASQTYVLRRRTTMSISHQILIEAVLAIATIALPPDREASVSDAQDQIAPSATQVAPLPLSEDPTAALVNQMPDNLQPAAPQSVDERIAYWGPYRGWYGPAYRYGYGSAPPRYYYRRGPSLQRLLRRLPRLLLRPTRRRPRRSLRRLLGPILLVDQREPGNLKSHTLPGQFPNSHSHSHNPDIGVMRMRNSEAGTAIFVRHSPLCYTVRWRADKSKNR